MYEVVCTAVRETLTKDSLDVCLLFVSMSSSGVGGKGKDANGSSERLRPSSSFSVFVSVLDKRCIDGSGPSLYTYITRQTRAKDTSKCWSVSTDTSLKKERCLPPFLCVSKTPFFSFPLMLVFFVS